MNKPTCNKGSEVSGKHWIAVATTALLVACGGGSSDSDKRNNLVQTGVFVDSAVAGIRYETETQQGTTNAAGQFQYRNNENINFYLGGISFPSAFAQSVMTPLTLVGTADPTNSFVVGIARLLQSLDDDGNPGNGIVISASTAAAAAGYSINFSDSLSEEAFEEAFENTAQQLLDAAFPDEERVLVSAEAALEHLQSNLTPIQGAWSGVSEGREVVLLFLPGGQYMHFEYGLSDGVPAEASTENGTAGMEFGLYSWNKTTGAFTSQCPLLDHNGEWGLSHPEPDGVCRGSTTVFSVDGNSLTINPGDEELVFTRISSAENPVIGGWLYEEGNMDGVLALVLMEGRYIIAQTEGEGDATAGMEAGIYALQMDNDGKRAFTNPCPQLDLNGTSGLSHPDGQGCVGNDEDMNASIGIYSNLLWFNNSDLGSDNLNFARVAP